VGAGGKTWRTYLSTNAGAQGGAVNARDRIGNGPWQNFKGGVIATSVDDLHSANSKITREKGRAFPANLNLTCNNWASSTFGSTMLGHRPHAQDPGKSGVVWNAVHIVADVNQRHVVRVASQAPRWTRPRASGTPQF
jgi:hypothetical protein